MQAPTTLQLIPWKDRRIPFRKDLDELPVLLERLLGTAARLVDLTAQQPSERMRLRRQGSWSAIEHIGHLILLQDRMEERVDDFTSRRAELCMIDLGEQTERLKGSTGRALGDVLEEFRLKRGYFVQRIHSLDPGALRYKAQHPCRPELMSVADMVLFLAEHDDHHLMVMRRMLDGGTLLR